MRHVFSVQPIGSRHLNQAPGIFVGLARLWIARIHHHYPVHIEAISVGSRWKRTDLHLPNAIGALGHRPALAKSDSGNVPAAAKLYRLRFRGEDPKGDLTISRYLG